MQSKVETPFQIVFFLAQGLATVFPLALGCWVQYAIIAHKSSKSRWTVLGLTVVNGVAAVQAVAMAGILLSFFTPFASMTGFSNVDANWWIVCASIITVATLIQTLLAGLVLNSDLGWPMALLACSSSSATTVVACVLTGKPSSFPFMM